ncbi:TonB-dependent receptor [Alloacidobacterium sp.]|uniref:TonB-dependent receptor n=1 Tax=Alloacidobacterium sp. TaxID=2951999 RepID=UPI002D35E315|nr:carboxypeptidase regulatory-like domain-containing protein [Alloacidobacterium sp.]HYK37053.1 carboxypeptidase regulatory-like domain-containing protein [Alloacidobacterium sp.]
MIRSQKLFAIALFVVGVASFAFGQGITTGTITGTVVDPSGAVIQHAHVQAIDTAKGTTLVTDSLADGIFSFRAVPVGTYRIEVTADGFNQTVVNNIQVASGVTNNLNSIQLTIGASTQVVVSGTSQPLLNTADSQVTTTFSTQSVQSLPLNNGFDTITEVIPGVVSTHGAGGTNFSNTNGDGFSVNGQSGRYNNFEIDGQTNNDNSVAGPQAFFGSQDGIEEIQVITNNYSAQYGRNAGAVVNYVTKSGSNAFHGSGFEFYQGQALSSLTNAEKNPLFGFCGSGQSPDSGCAAPVVPRFVENRYGGTLGGPILKDKLFFFGSTFWDHVRTGVTPSQSLPDLTPTPAGIQALQADFPGNPAVAMLSAYGPYGVTVGNPTPAGATVFENVTGPNGATFSIPFAGVQRTIPTPFNDQEELGRLDWQPTGKDHLFVRYFYQDQLSTGVPFASTGAGSISAGSYVDVPGTTHSVGADWTHVFSDRWVDQLRYSFQQSNVLFQGGAIPACTANNLTVCPAQITFTGSNQDSGFGYNAGSPQGRIVKVTQIQNNATWTRGNHTILFGGEFDYQNSPNIFLPLYNGDYLYSDFSSFLQDSGALLLANGNPVIPFTEPDAAGYVQDDWKVTPNFTAHLGMRWEYFGQAVNKLHDETVARESNPATAFWDPSLPLADKTVGAVNENYKNFEPRIGFAWNPSFDKELVVNGGYAINANPAYYNIFLLDAIASPVANTGVVGCSGNCQPANGNLTGASVRSTNLSSLPIGVGVDPRFRDQTYVPANFRTPYVQTYTLALQHQIGHGAVGEIRYVGSKTTSDFRSVDQNPFLLPVAASFPNYVSPSSLCSDSTQPGFGRPSCNSSNLAYVTNGGWANYSGLQLNLSTRNYRGLTGTVSYTWSRSIDNSTDVFSTGAAGNTNAFPQNPQDPDVGERGVSGNSYPNVVGIAFNYELPKFAASNGFVSRLVNGFSLGSFYRYNSGQPFNAFQPLTLDGFTGDTSFCDGAFNGSSVGSALDTCRLVVSNRKAPLNTVAYLNPYTGPTVGGSPTLGTPQYVEYNTDFIDNNGNYNPGTPIDPASAHWIVNNQAYAQAVGNPYPGSGRNILRGSTFSDLDLSLYKTTQVTERVSIQLQFNVYNALNQQFRATGDSNVGDYSPSGFNPFLNTAFNSFATVPGNTSGTRFVILGGKVIF